MLQLIVQFKIKCPVLIGYPVISINSTCTNLFFGDFCGRDVIAVLLADVIDTVVAVADAAAAAVRALVVLEHRVKVVARALLHEEAAHVHLRLRADDVSDGAEVLAVVTHGVHDEEDLVVRPARADLQRALCACVWARQTSKL